MLRFLPDAETITPEVVVALTNCTPTVRGYAGIESGIDIGIAAPAEAITGAALCLPLSGDPVLFAGTNDSLLKGGTASWTDVTDAANYASGYNASTARWRFVQFGNSTFAIADGIQLQEYTVGDTDFGKVANAPKAAYMETAAGFVMLANTNDTDTGLSTAYGSQGNRWWCSQIFNPTGTWAPDVATQATTGLLVDSPGPITGLARLGSDIVAFKKSAVHVGRYVGPPIVWQWQRMPGDIGCNVQEAAVSIGNMILFIGEEDIYSFDGVSKPQSIGAGIREWFFSNLNKSYANLISGVHDQANGRVFWWYPSGTDGTLNSVLIYNYRRDAWGHATATARIAIRAQASGVIYDNFDDLVVASTGVATPTYNDIMDIPYNSGLFQGGIILPSYIGSDDKVYTLSGEAGSWSFTTGDIGDQSTVTLLRGVRPRWRTRPTTSTLAHRHRMDLGDAPTTKPAVSLSSDRFNVLHASRWHSWTLSCTGTGEIESFRTDMVEQGLE